VFKVREKRTGLLMTAKMMGRFFEKGCYERELNALRRMIGARNVAQFVGVYETPD
jgi:hypothetical protein